MRSLLFVPAHKDGLIRKAFETEADGIIFDLEDSCPANSREKGIDNINYYSDLTQKKTIVRIGKRVHAKIVRADYIMYPKAETFDYLDINPYPPAILLVETGLGVMNLFNMLRSYNNNIEGIAFGNEDYFADTGCSDYSFPEAMVVNCAKAYNKIAIDTVHVDVHNLDDLALKCKDSADKGFDGRLCIHPKEISVVNAFYTPTLKEYEHALRVIELYDKAESEGDGVAIIDGVYVAPPMVRRSKKIITKYEKYE